MTMCLCHGGARMPRSLTGDMSACVDLPCHILYDSQPMFFDICQCRHGGSRSCKRKICAETLFVSFVCPPRPSLSPEPDQDVSIHGSRPYTDYAGLEITAKSAVALRT